MPEGAWLLAVGKTYGLAIPEYSMDVKTALLIAFGLAFGLPYLTVALLEGAGTVGIYLLSGLFFAVLGLVVWSDVGSGSEETG